MQRRRMIPLIIPAAVSLASSAIDTWRNATAAKTTAPQGQPKVAFEEVLKKAGGLPATQAAGMLQAALSQGQVAPMAAQFMQSPEVQAALNAGGSSQAAGISISANGSVSVATATGGCRNLVLSPQTQALAAQLRQALGAMNGQQLVLPAGASAPGVTAANAPAVIFQGM